MDHILQNCTISILKLPSLGGLSGTVLTDFQSLTKEPDIKKKSNPEDCMNLDRILLLCCLLPYLLFTKPNQYRWELLKVDQCHAAKFKMFSSWSMKDSPVKKKTIPTYRYSQWKIKWNLGTPLPWGSRLLTVTETSSLTTSTATNFSLS